MGTRQRRPDRAVRRPQAVAHRAAGGAGGFRHDGPGRAGRRGRRRSPASRCPSGPLPERLFDGPAVWPRARSPRSRCGEVLRGAIGKRFTIEPGQEVQVPFVVAWSFPRASRPGERNFYGNRFAGRRRRSPDTWRRTSIGSPARRGSGTTRGTTRRCRTGCWTGCSRPCRSWPPSTCQWWGNGRFWAWEGVGCCDGTCTHVWNYEHAMARLFPQLERSAREMQDFGVGLRSRRPA